MKIEIWSDIACPWCYIGKVRFEKALAQYEHKDDVQVIWRSYQLQPDAPTENAPTTVDHLMEKYGRSREGVMEMMRNVTDVAAGEGITYHLDRAVASNTLDAHRLTKLGEAKGMGKPVMERLMQAYQSEGANVADADTLVRLGAEAGLAEADVRAMLASDAYLADVRADQQRGQAIGVNGVPFFVIDEQHGVSGAQPTEFFLSALQQLGPQKPKLKMVEVAGDGATAGGAADEAVCGPDGCEVPATR